jgi:hypothetical protein
MNVVAVVIGVLAIPMQIFGLAATNQIFGYTLDSEDGWSLTYGDRDWDTLLKVNDYCFEHADEIVNGGNPVQDLITSGLIESHLMYQNKHV